jgi:hypothetical protein
VSFYFTYVIGASFKAGSELRRAHV